MKFNKFVSAIIASALLICPLCSCSDKTAGTTEAPVIQTSNEYFAVMPDIIEAIYAPSQNGMYVVDQEEISSIFGGIETSHYESIYAYSQEDGKSRIFIGVAKDKENLEKAKDELDEFLNGHFTSKEEAEGLSTASYEYGNFCFFVVHPEGEKMKNTVIDAIDYSRGIKDKEEVDERIAEIIDNNKKAQKDN